MGFIITWTDTKGLNNIQQSYFYFVSVVCFVGRFNSFINSSGVKSISRQDFAQQQTGKIPASMVRESGCSPIRVAEKYMTAFLPHSFKTESP
jgi:hypothetical protein